LVALCFVLLSALSFGGFAQANVAADAVSASGALSIAEEIQLPILMYHSILKSKSNKFTIKPSQLDSDFEALKEAGFTSVFMSEVINWVDGKGTLPAKPIVITFDDGHYNNLYYGLDIAKKHDMKIMINPVTAFSLHSVNSGDHSNPNYSHLTWDQMGEMYRSGLVEFGNHTHRMHNFKPRFGIMRISGESDEDYREKLYADIERAQQLLEQSGVPRPKTFAYPFGKYTAESREMLLDMGFRALLTCNEWISTIRKGDETCLHKLGRFNRCGSWGTDKMMSRVLKTG